MLTIYSPLAGDDIDDDGSADKGGDGVKGNNTTLAWEIANEVAHQRYYRAAKQGGREQLAMVIGGEQQAGDMGYGQSDKGHWAAEGGGDGGEQACYDEQPVAHSHNVHTKVLGISVAQHQRVQGFYQQ